MTTDHAERKLAAIFATDLERYSRPMDIDEVGTLRTLTARREIVDAHIVLKRARIFTTTGSAISRAALVRFDEVPG
jgi:adenylate cyclase